MDASRPVRWPAHVVRLAALWILAGATFKLLLGTPGDLPSFVRDLPIGQGLAYRLVIGIETFVAVVALASPRRGWPLVAAVLVAFLAGLVMQVAEGAASCGCFGAKLKIPPLVMIGIDGTLLLAILLSRPWRLPAKDLSFDLIFAGAALVLAVAAPIVIDREKGSIGSLAKYEVLEPARWVGMSLAETPLAKFIDVAQAADGYWLLYRDGCEICANCMGKIDQLREERDVTLVRVPDEPGVEVKVHGAPPWAHRFDLPATVQWSLHTPSQMVVEGGKVVSGRGIEARECD